jgi:hypothetical protein
VGDSDEAFQCSPQSFVWPTYQELKCESRLLRATQMFAVIS